MALHWVRHEVAPSEWSEMTPIRVHIGSRLHTGKGN